MMIIINTNIVIVIVVIIIVLVVLTYLSTTTEVHGCMKVAGQGLVHHRQCLEIRGREKFVSLGNLGACWEMNLSSRAARAGNNQRLLLLIPETFDPLLTGRPHSCLLLVWELVACHAPADGR